jgi:hypothetical protein
MPFPVLVRHFPMHCSHFIHRRVENVVDNATVHAAGPALAGPAFDGCIPGQDTVTTIDDAMTD